MKKSIITVAIAVWSVIGFAAPFTVNRMFGDNMVLQREKEVPVWGTAAPGAAVTVEFKDIKVSVKCAENGKWQVKLPAMQAESSPQQLIIRCGKQRKVIKNVLVGEVLLFFGQSHIELTYNMKLRELKSPDKRTMTPEARQNLEGKINNFITNVPADPLFRNGRIGLTCYMNWYVCDTKTVRHFGVVAYNLGAALRKELGVPVAILNMARGCSSIESWIPEEYYSEPVLLDERIHIKDFVKFYENKTAKKLTQEEEDAYYTAYCKNPKRNMQRYLKDGKVKPASRAWVWQHLTAVQPTGSIMNAMRYVCPFQVRGMVWWQGGTNYCDPAGHYFKKLGILFDVYRKYWNVPEMKFFVVLQGQSKNYSGIYSNFRLEQFSAAETYSNVFLVNNVMTPEAESKMVHPYGEKVQVGKDAAKLLMKHLYGKNDMIGSGPLFDSVEFNGGKAVVSFRFDNGLHTSDGKAPVGFELAGKDRKYYPAQAVIDGGKVVVSAASVPDPEYVRYMWEDVKTVCNLVNKEELTAFPFDTQFEFFKSKNKINGR